MNVSSKERASPLIPGSILCCAWLDRRNWCGGGGDSGLWSSKFLNHKIRNCRDNQDTNDG